MTEPYSQPASSRPQFAKAIIYNDVDFAFASL